jgi:hypothetical protein
MAPDSVIPSETLDTSAPTPPAADLIAQIEAQLATLEQESRSLKEQAAQRDKQAADIRVRLATIAGTRTATVKVPQIGQTIAGKGIYMGVWQPKDRRGNSLNRKFAVYAAPEDLTDASGQKLVATFKDTGKRMTALRNWHGHDGGDFANDTALYRGLADGSAIGKWFIPTRDLLTGTDLDGNKVQNDYLVAHKDKLGEITTSREGCGSYDYPNYYWTLSEHRDVSYGVWCARLADGGVDWGYKVSLRQSCRPCRVEALTI